MASGAFGVQRNLGFFPRLPGCLAPPSPGYVLQPRRCRSVHKDQVRTQGVPPGLEKHSGVQHDRRHGLARPTGPDSTSDFLPHRRVHEGVQIGQALRVGKDDLPERTAIDLSIGRPRQFGPAGSHGLANGVPGEHFMPDRVGVDYGAARRGQPGRHDALAGADSADQSDHRFVL